MWLRSWLRSTNPSPARRTAERGKLALETLDERALPSLLAPTNISTGSTPYSVVVADINHDTFDDVVVANTGASTVSVLLGKGDGTFKPAINSNTGTAPRSVAV